MAQDEGRFVSGDQDAGGHVDEGAVHAWLDGQLGAEESGRVEAHVASCEACAGMVAEARGFVAASSRILTALDGVPARVLPRQRGRVRVWQVRAAAAVVVMALGAAAVLQRGGPTIASTRHEVASRSPEAAGAVARSQQEQEAPLLVPERRSTASPPVAAPMPAAPEPVAPMADEALEKEQKTAPRRVGNENARAEQLRKDLKEESSNRLAGAKSAATTNRKAGGVAGGGGIALRGAPSNANAPASAPSMAAQGEPAADSASVMQADRLDSRAREGNISAGGAVAGRAAKGVAAPPAPAARQRVRDSLFSRPPAATDSGYVPMRIQRQITGRVVDAAARTPIPGATVRIARTSVATTTNDTGAFALPAAPHDTLDVRRIGYSPRRVALSPQQRDTTIVLVGSPLALSQTVVTGALGDKRAVQKERRITGHVVDSATHNPVGGATVVIAYTTHGVFTNDSGAFAIMVPPREVRLVARRLGYLSVFVTVPAARQDTTIVLGPWPPLEPVVPPTSDSASPR